MKNITYINAGAGSGKTYKLTHILADLIKDGKVNPEEIIMTTFTTKAAGEMKEKAKAVLCEEGKFSEATRLDQALIGTVHSVCQQMIGKYWFLLGLGPNMNVMTDEDKDFYISQSLADLPEENELACLHNFCEMFDIREKDGVKVKGYDYDFWQSKLVEIIKLTQNFEIVNYDESIKKSLEFLGNLKKSSVTMKLIDERFDAMVAECREYVGNSNRIRKKDDYFSNFERLSKGKGRKTHAWFSDVKKFFKREWGGVACAEVLDRIDERFQSVEFYDIQETYIKLMFGLASRWKEKYAQYKREKNLIDFNDMEKYMCKLLTINDVRKDISKSYKYLFVDEFQDSSPIQVKIFDALSELVEHSYWVGDYKQAIYGFRGSATELTKAVVDKISTKTDACDVDILNISYRSLPDIVNVCNSVFCKTFDGLLDGNEVKLDANRENTENVGCLRYINTVDERGVANYVAKLISENIIPKDIAVLGRDNYQLENVAKVLCEYGIKVNYGNALLKDTKTYILLSALLRLMSSDKDSLAKSQIAFITEKGCGVKELLEHRLDEYDNFAKDVKLINNLELIKPRLKQLSVSKAVESVIMELNLFNIIKGVEKNPRLGNSALNSIINASKAYEDHCVKMNFPATVDGFISYVSNTEMQVPGDIEGVQLNTYHSSKGLEWKYVIMLSLSDDIDDKVKYVKKNVYNIKPIYVEHPSAGNFNPNLYIRYLPWIFGSASKNTVPGDIETKIENATKDEFNDNKKECNRLFYVGMTRPRDVLVLDVKGETPFACPQALGLTIGQESEDGWDIFSTGHEFVNCTVGEDQAESLKNTKPNDSADRLGLVFDNVKSDILSPRYISPSSVYEKVDVLSYKNFGKRVSLAGDVEMNVVGDCIHQIFAGIEEPRPAYKIELSETIGAYGLSAVIKSPDEVVESWNNLISYLKENHGDAVKTYHERPFRLECDGQTIVGSIDFVYQTNDGDILVDFKTCPLGQSAILNPESDFFAGKYGGQLNTYTEALEAAGEKVLKKYLYYPVSGLIVEI